MQMYKRYIREVAPVLFLLSSFALTCSNDDSTGPDDVGVVISDDVSLIEEDGKIALTDMDSTTLFYTLEDTLIDIQPGDILVGTENGGYLRKVVSVSIEDNNVTVNTEDATLTDAIINGTIDTTISFSISPDEHGSSNAVQTVSYFPGVSVIEGGIGFDHVRLFDDEIGSASVEIEITDGSITFEPDFEWHAKITDGAIEEVKAIATGSITVDFDLAVHSTGSFGKNDKVTLFEATKVTVQMVGWLPVVEVIRFRFVAGFEAVSQVVGTTSFGFTDKGFVRFGAHYKNRDYSPVWEKENSFTAHDLVWQAKAGINVSAYIKPRLDLELYAVTGPYIEVKPYASFEAEVTFNPFCWDFEALAGIEGNVGIQAHILDYELYDYYIPLAKYEETLDADKDCLNDNCFLPYVPGAHMTYLEHVEQDTYTYTVTVLPPLTLFGRRVFPFESAYSDVDWTLSGYCYCSPGGDYWAGSDASESGEFGLINRWTCEFDPPYLSMPAAPELGRIYEYEYEYDCEGEGCWLDGKRCRGELKPVAFNSISVPAGQFNDALQVEEWYEIVGEDDRQQWTYWWVQGLGIVKAQRETGTERSAELVSFDIPGIGSSGLSTLPHHAARSRNVISDSNLVGRAYEVFGRFQISKYPHLR